MKKKLAAIIFILTLCASWNLQARGIDSSIAQMLRGFNGNFYADIMRAGCASDNPNILINPSLSYKSKFVSSIELYSQNRYSNISENIKYQNINFIMKEREILKIPDVQFGFHYSIYALDNIEEYNNINNQPIFGGYTNDEESLFLFNMNMPVNIINNDIRAGANLKFYRHSLSSFNINSSALDLGIKTTFNKFNLGLSLKNLISKDFRYYQKKYNLPKQYIIGTSYNFEILPNINFILNNDYTINTQNTDNNLAFGFDVQFNSIIQNSKINFLYGIDNIYIAHSFGIRFEYQNSFNCGFAYALNKNKELGDNTLFFLGWQFGAIEEKKYEKYLELEAAGERAYRGGDWNTALECWQQAAALYPLKKTNAKVSFDLLTNHLQKIEKLNLELYKSNKNHFENGLQYFKNQNYYEALLQFLAIKYADDFNNKNIYNDAIYYIKQITEKFKNIGDASQSPTKSDTFNTATSQQLQEDTDRINLSNIINAFIEMNRLELAEEYLKKYTFSDTEKIIIEKQIIDKRLKLKDYETAKIRYQQLTIELRAAFKNNDYQKVIEIYNILQNNYKNYDFQRNSDFEIYYNLALENFNAAKDSPRKITNAELMQIEDYYKSAAKHYLNYLLTKNKTELFNSIIFYERILKIDPEHKSKAEYLKIKKLYEEQ